MSGFFLVGSVTIISRVESSVKRFHIIRLFTNVWRTPTHCSTALPFMPLTLQVGFDGFLLVVLLLFLHFELVAGDRKMQQGNSVFLHFVHCVITSDATSSRVVVVLKFFIILKFYLRRCTLLHVNDSHRSFIMTISLISHVSEQQRCATQAMAHLMLEQNTVMALDRSGTRNTAEPIQCLCRVGPARERDSHRHWPWCLRMRRCKLVTHSDNGLGLPAV